jgi:DNA-binding beta-propeller fold protein YncE
MLKFAMFCLIVVAPLLAQDDGNDHLRGLTRAAPALPVERIDLKVTPTLTLEGISAVAGDAQGHVYVLHRPGATGDPVVVVDRKGNFVRSWGKGMFKTPHGIRVDPAGNVWTIDAGSSMVYKFTPHGEKLMEISVGDIPDPSRPFCGATDVAFATNGHVYVSDGYCNGRVLEYEAGGKKVREWGKRGAGPGEFNVAHGIAISPQGNVYVADRGNGRLQWFDPQGKFLGEFKYGGELYNVTFNAAGELFVSTHVKGVSLDNEFSMVKIDARTGKMLGKYDIRSHQLSAAPDGALLPATRSGDLVVFRPGR